MKIAVLTANFGGFDTVKSIPQQDIEFDRFYYTESNSPFPFHTIDNRLRAKVFKIIPHILLPDYDVYVWIDGNVQVKSNNLVSTVIKALGSKSLAISPHPSRGTIYEEADFIINSIKGGSKYLKSRYSIDSIQKEMNTLPKDLDGLYWCGLFARRNTPHINAAFDEWFRRNVLYTNFDQISFVDIVHKFYLEVGTFNLGDFYNNEFYQLTPHK